MLFFIECFEPIEVHKLVKKKRQRPIFFFNMDKTSKNKLPPNTTYYIGYFIASTSNTTTILGKNARHVKYAHSLSWSQISNCTSGPDITRKGCYLTENSFGWHNVSKKRIFQMTSWVVPYLRSVLRIWTTQGTNQMRLLYVIDKCVL